MAAGIVLPGLGFKDGGCKVLAGLIAGLVFFIVLSGVVWSYRPANSALPEGDKVKLHGAPEGDKVMAWYVIVLRLERIVYIKSFP
jgi:hypothetical protein